MGRPLLTAVFLAAACGDSTPGARGLVEFTPRDCGRPACTFAENIAADSTLTIDIAPAEDDVSLDGVDLDVEGAGVTPESNTCFEVEFGDAGDVEIRVIAADGEELDHLDVMVVTAQELSLELDDGEALGPEETGLHDEEWILTDGDPASFYVTPLSSAGDPLMGRFDYYQLTASPELETEINADVADGHFELSLPEGEYTTSIRNDNLADVDVLFVVE